MYRSTFALYLLVLHVIVNSVLLLALVLARVVTRTRVHNLSVKKSLHKNLSPCFYPVQYCTTPNCTVNDVLFSVVQNGDQIAKGSYTHTSNLVT